MRIMFLAMSLLLFLAPVSAAPAPPPWAAPDRILINDRPEGNYYFIRSSVQLCIEGIIVDTVMEYDQKADDLTAKYIVETVRIVSFANRLRIVASKGYSAKGILLFDHPPEEWQSPNSLIHGGLVPAVIDYWQKNLSRLVPKPRPISDTSWFTRVLTTSSGDTYYFHPGWIAAGSASITVSIRVDHRTEGFAGKFSEQDIKIDPVNRKFYVDSITLFDADGKIINIYSSEHPKKWLDIKPGWEKEPLFDQILEYCRKSYITLVAPFRGAFPRLIPYITGDTRYFFNPDSVLVRDGCLWVESVFDPGSGAYARLEVLRLSDRKTTTAGSRTFDDAGKEVNYSHTGIQWWNWGEIKPGSPQETLFAAVLAYCRENDISLEE